MDLGEVPKVESVGFVDQLWLWAGGECGILESEVLRKKCEISNSGGAGLGEDLRSLILNMFRWRL